MVVLLKILPVVFNKFSCSVTHNCESRQLIHCFGQLNHFTNYNLKSKSVPISQVFTIINTMIRF